MKYYVYQLVNSLDGKVFYIGKGSGNRIHNHEQEAKGNKSNHKLNKIRKIKRNGGKILKRIVGLFADEDRAYEYEASLIQSTPGLTNIKLGEIKAEDTLLGRRMYAAWLIKTYVDRKRGEYLMEKVRQDGCDLLTFQKQQRAMDLF